MTRVERETELKTAALGAVAGDAAPWSRWPLRVGGETGTLPVERLVGGTEILAAHLPRVARAFHLATLSRPARKLSEAAEEALQRLSAELELSEPGRAALGAEIAGVASRLDDATLVGLGALAAGEIHERCVAAARRPHVEAQAARARELSRRLGEVLAVDAAHGTASTEALASSLGSASSFLDADALARAVGSLRGSVRLDAARRERIERLVASLEEGAASLETAPDVRLVEGADALASAASTFDEISRGAVGLFRAVRAARLELEGAYDPHRHGAALARFDWRALSSEELSSLPRVVAVADEDLLTRELSAFSSLLRSGRPVHVRVVRDPLPRAREGGAAPFDPAGLSMAHRDVFVLQATLARPEDLARGLARLAGSPLPGVAVVSVAESEDGWLALLAADAGRVAPSFLFDPAAGTHWAHRFEDGGNPQPERLWPRFGDEPFTFADAATLSRDWSGSFRIVPRESWPESPMTVEAWVDAAPEARQASLPFVRLFGPDGTEERAEVSPDLALACLERAAAWRAIRELAGDDDEYARRAAARAREEAEAEHAAKLEEVRLSHEAEVDRVRRETAGEAIDRVVRVLLGTGTAVEAPKVEAKPAAAAPAPEPKPKPEPEPEPAPIDADPYVVSALCTSCQDCININPRMFRYDGNKQAYVDDAGAGTFEELVRAAEKCPARCIKPGLPRNGDPTVDDALLARAAKFR